MKKSFIAVILIGMLPLIGFSQRIVKFDAWNPSQWNKSDLVTTEIVANPVKEASISNKEVLKITKNGGDNAKPSHCVLSKNKVTLSKNNCIFEIKVLFPIKENSVQNTKLGLRMGDKWDLEVTKEINADNNWQTVQFDFSKNSKFATVFEQNRDTTVTQVLFFSRKYTDQKPNIILYIDDLKMITK